MTTRVTEGARRERHGKRESLFFLLGLPPSFFASCGFAAQRSRARVLPLLNLKKKRGCSQSKALFEYSLTGPNQNLKRKKNMRKSISVENDKRDSCLVDPVYFVLNLGKLWVRNKWINKTLALFSKGEDDEVPMMQLSHALYDINLNRSNSDCTTRKTDVSPFVRMSVERTSMRRKKVSEDSEKFNNVFYLTDWSKEKEKRERKRERKKAKQQTEPNKSFEGTIFECFLVKCYTSKILQSTLQRTPL